MITGPGPHRPAGSGMWAWSPSVRLTGVRSSGPGHGFDGPGRLDRSRATCMLGSSGPAAGWLGCVAFWAWVFRTCGLVAACTYGFWHALVALYLRENPKKIFFFYPINPQT
ncbi:hypothetical protein M0R45_013433 [Rubus argutus]|uniref:Uncharacterized protein n=1 Tax=Rubus argutus TaxID=59490 RepID=A0AAW1XI97_RUBAR